MVEDYPNRHVEESAAALFVGVEETLSERAISLGLAALDDGEALRLLLAHYADPHMAPVHASQLIARFGCMRKVLSAEYAALRQVVDQRTALSLQLVFDAARRILAADLPGRDLLQSHSAVSKYLLGSMSHLETEEFRVLHLDKRNQLIADEVLWRGTIDHCAVYPRDIIKRCLERNTAHIIVAHNHPTGCPEPSPADIAMTKAIDAAAHLFGIKLHDHIVVGRDHTASFRAKGLL